MHALRLGFLALVLAACGDDPVNHSEPVTINLKAKSSDVVSGTVSDQKNITTESGNPYAAFVSEAETVLGKDPGRIAVTGASLLLGSGSTGVTTLGEVFTGEVRVSFIIGGVTHPVATATVAATTGAGPLTLAADFDSTDLTTANFASMLAADFQVHITGPAAASFQSKGADADLEVTLTFAAYE